MGETTATIKAGQNGTPLIHFETGAVREAAKEEARYDLVPFPIVNILRKQIIISENHTEWNAETTDQIISALMIHYPCHVDHIHDCEIFLVNLANYIHPDITPIELFAKTLAMYARVMAEGAKKYGDRNWEKGIPTVNLFNHAMNHLVQHAMGDTSEDHLGHAFWNVAAMVYFLQDQSQSKS